MSRYAWITVCMLAALVTIGHADDDEYRSHKGGKEISLYGDVSSYDTISWEIGSSAGYFITDSIQIGIDLYLMHEETVEERELEPAAGEEEDGDEPETVEYVEKETGGDAQVFASYYFPTLQENPWEPFVGMSLGYWLDDEDSGPSIGAKLGVNYYITDDFGIALEYDPTWDIKYSSLGHNVHLEVFYQFW